MFGIYSSLMFLGGSMVYLLLLLPLIALPAISVVYFIWEAVWKFRSRRHLL